MEYKKYTILTGATSGIGFETAKKLCLSGHHLILANRNKSKAEKVKIELEQLNPNCEIDLLELNLASFESIKRFANEVITKYEYINNLINNAGVFMRETKYTEEGFEMSSGVNHLGTYLLTELLKDKLHETKNSKIIMVSSVGCYWGSIKISKNTYYKRINSFKTYFDSKLANLIYVKELADSYKDKSIIIKAADPGIVYSHIFKWKTKFGKFLEKIQKKIMKSPEQGADVICKLLDTDTFNTDDNILYTYNKARKLPRIIRNPKIRKMHMLHTEKIIAKPL